MLFLANMTHLPLADSLTSLEIEVPNPHSSVTRRTTQREGMKVNIAHVMTKNMYP